MVFGINRHDSVNTTNTREKTEMNTTVQNTKAEIGLQIMLDSNGLTTKQLANIESILHKGRKHHYIGSCVHILILFYACNMAKLGLSSVGGAAPTCADWDDVRLQAVFRLSNTRQFESEQVEPDIPGNTRGVVNLVSEQLQWAKNKLKVMDTGECCCHGRHWSRPPAATIDVAATVKSKAHAATLDVGQARIWEEAGPSTSSPKVDVQVGLRMQSESLEDSRTSVGNGKKQSPKSNQGSETMERAVDAVVDKMTVSLDVRSVDREVDLQKVEDVHVHCVKGEENKHALDITNVLDNEAMQDDGFTKVSG
ncbi:hypothetical protein MLD38_006313 [Melastoma candidum]|uniref:Uncharacterized protein n=1 Tax=Melastoma candidum TaxID=119954 RepID=A0ACB9RNP3_9MYRT|nr:hypothetical protein MLD38_006313 [Melastoma candidum]